MAPPNKTFRLTDAPRIRFQRAGSNLIIFVMNTENGIEWGTLLSGAVMGAFMTFLTTDAADSVFEAGLGSGGQFPPQA